MPSRSSNPKPYIQPPISAGLAKSLPPASRTILAISSTALLFWASMLIRISFPERLLNVSRGRSITTKLLLPNQETRQMVGLLMHWMLDKSYLPEELP
jgi:hypothetical protein